jgi:hypothetical protein
VTLRPPGLPCALGKRLSFVLNLFALASSEPPGVTKAAAAIVLLRGRFEAKFQTARVGRGRMCDKDLRVSTAGPDALTGPWCEAVQFFVFVCAGVCIEPDEDRSLLR